MTDNVRDDNIQHGIDDDPHNDAEKGAALGGVGGAVVGGVAGAMTGPVGAVVGAVAGGAAGAAASGVGVAAVDRVDNDNTITGLGDDETRDVSDQSSEVAARDNLNTGIGDDTPAVRTDGSVPPPRNDGSIV